MREGSFSVLIPEGRERGSGYVAVKHGTRYTIRLGNHSPNRADATVTVDGKVVGTFRLDPHQTASIETPPGDSGHGCFTFYRAGSDEGRAVGAETIASPDRGLVSVLFRSERPRPPAAMRTSPTHYPLSFGQLRSMDRPADQGTTETCASSGEKGVEKEGIAFAGTAGVTGLSGESDQRFVTVAALDVDPSLDLTINLRLVCDENVPRPLAPTGPRSTPVPPPVG